jgi:HEAT repeat protein
MLILALAAGALLTAGDATLPGRVDAVVHAPDAEFATVPPPAWSAADPADSLYRAGREALNRGNYERAAELFEQIVARYPKSEYAGDALYWRAFALYRRGGAQQLERAVAALDRQREAYPGAATRRDADALAVRIRGELARGGDARAAERVVGAARGAERGAGESCNEQDTEMRVAALSALQQMDDAQALPILREVLARRGPCSEVLRRKAVFLVAQAGEDASAGTILLDVIGRDPSPEVRREAVFWLSQVKGERTVTILDSVLRATPDRELQERAVFALSQHESPRAAQLLRDLASRDGTDEELRSRAIFALGQQRGEPADVAFLRQLYPRLTSERLREQVLQAVAQSDGAEAGAWLLEIARDTRNPLELRKKALFWAAQRDGAAPMLVGLYDSATDAELREHVIWLLSQQDDAAAVDKLISIAKSSPDRELRKKAIFWLGQSDDPRVKQILLDIINQS